MSKEAPETAPASDLAAITKSIIDPDTPVTQFVTTTVVFEGRKIEASGQLTDTQLVTLLNSIDGAGLTVQERRGGSFG